MKTGKPLKHVTAIALTVTLTASWPLLAQERDPEELPALALAAWRCATALEYSDPDNHARQELFELGLGAAREFFEAVDRGDIDTEAANQSVPVMFALSMQGPNRDFVMGRWWELAANQAFEEIHEGIEPEWDLERQDTMAQLNAEHFYRAANCALLR